MFLRNGLFILGLCVALPAYASAPPEAAGPDAPTSASASSPTIPSATPPATPAPIVHSSDYIIPTWIDLLHTMVRFNALDLQDDNLVDEYAAVTDCEIYKFYYKNEFKWNEIRKKIYDSAELNTNSYPVHYTFYVTVKLDRYDFESRLFRFTDLTAIRNVNVFVLFSTPNALCANVPGRYIPKTFEAVSSKPFNAPGLPLAPADAQSLLRQMEADKNADRTLLVQFNMTVTYIDRLQKKATGRMVSNKNAEYYQALDKANNNTLRIDVHLDSVNFFEDMAMTKLAYSFKP